MVWEILRPKDVNLGLDKIKFVPVLARGSAVQCFSDHANSMFRVISTSLPVMSIGAV